MWLKTDWDEASWGTMTQDPQMIKALHVDVRDGTYDKVAAENQANAAREAQAAEAARLEQVKAEKAVREENARKAEERKSAAPSTTSVAGKSANTDYLSESDEDFEKWYAGLADKY